MNRRNPDTDTHTHANKYFKEKKKNVGQKQRGRCQYSCVKQAGAVYQYQIKTQTKNNIERAIEGGR